MLGIYTPENYEDDWLETQSFESMYFLKEHDDFPWRWSCSWEGWVMKFQGWCEAPQSPRCRWCRWCNRTSGLQKPRFRLRNFQKKPHANRFLEFATMMLIGKSERRIVRFWKGDESHGICKNLQQNKSKMCNHKTNYMHKSSWKRILLEPL